MKGIQIVSFVVTGFLLLGFVMINYGVYAETPKLAVDDFGHGTIVTTSSTTYTIPELAIDPCLDCFENAKVETSSETTTECTTFWACPHVNCERENFAEWVNIVLDEQRKAGVSSERFLNDVNECYTIPDLAINRAQTSTSSGGSSHTNAPYFEKRALDELRADEVKRMEDGSIFIGSDDHDIHLGGGTEVRNNGKVPIVLNFCDAPYDLPLPKVFCVPFYFDGHEFSR